METTAPNATPDAPPPPRPLWPAPVFVLGVGALLAVWFLRPLWPEGVGSRPGRDLAAARAQLVRPDGDAELALKLAGRALEAAEAQGDRVGEAAFLAGSAHLRLAELSAPAAAAPHWRKAMQLLEQAEELGVEEDDRVALRYRLGKAGLALGNDTPAAIRRLEEAVAHMGNRAEGYALLVAAYLSLPTPDLAKALEANRALRDSAEITEAQLMEAKLQGAELLLRMGKPAEARRSLENIGEPAPPAVVMRARLLEARCHQQEKRWGDAARLYGLALSDKRAAVPEPSRVFYDMGLCYHKGELPKEAAAAWRECVQRERSPEAEAAAVRWADLLLADGAAKEAAALLKLAVAKVAAGQGWKNDLIDQAAVVEVFERAVSVLRATAGSDLALEVLDEYARLAPPRRVLALRGEVLAEKAVARLNGSAVGMGGSGEAEARELFGRAAAACAEAAALPGLKAAERAELLWASTRHHLSAREPKKAAERLEELVKVEADSERLAEAWYRLGQVREQAGGDAGAAYRKCMEHNTRWEYLARHQIAMALLRAPTPQIDEAEATLVQNVNALRFDTGNEALPLSLSALANLLYKRRDYRGVLKYLEQLLPRLKDGPEATLARFQLADSYRQLAAQHTQSLLLSETMSAETRAHHQKLHREWLQKAADEFTALGAYLEEPKAAARRREHLSQELREQVPFITAKCWFNLGQFDKALALYEGLIKLYPGRVEQLEALGGAVSCHAAVGDLDHVRQRLIEIQKLLPSMPSDVREAWAAWLEEALVPLRKLDEEKDKKISD